MKTRSLWMALMALLTSFVCNEAYAYDIKVENADGVMIYYNYINDGTELEVTTYSSTYYNSYSGTVVIPEEVTFMNRTRKVTNIGNYAFYKCSGLTSVTIGNSVTSIGEGAFRYCGGLTSVHITDLAAWCNIKFSDGYSNPFCYAKHFFVDGREITDLVIPNSVTSIGGWAFYNCRGLTSVTIPGSVTSIGESAFCYCTGLTSVTIPNSVTSIGGGAFYGCRGLTSVTIPNSVTSIGSNAFYGCSGLTSVTIGNSVTSIGYLAFDECDLESVISLIEEPFAITGKSSDYKTFSLNTFNNATLYVPSGTIAKYKATEGWKDFLFIEEVGGGITPEEKVCAKPTIHYQNGQLSFQCATEGAVCKGEISDADIQSFEGNEVQLGVTYHISVYATKPNYTNSETATATLCWIDVEPQKEGITDDATAVTEVKAMPVLIQQDGNYMTISGTPAGTPIRIYDLSGKLIGSTTAVEGATRVNVAAAAEKVVIVKVGERSVKVRI